MSDGSPRARPKGDKRARTRSALLAAARALIGEVGYEKTTMDAVARRAGMTTGAIYGNFRNRNELFVALAETYWAPIKPKVRADATFAEKMAAIAEATIAAIPERRDAAIGRLTGMAHTLTDAELQGQVREVSQRSFAMGAAWLKAGANDDELPMPAEQLAAVVHAMMEGILFQRFLTPELMPDEAIRAAFAAVAGKRQP